MSLLKICKEANDMFRQHGVLRYDVFKLSNTDVSMEGFTNIATTVDKVSSTIAKNCFVQKPVDSQELLKRIRI